MAEWYANDKFSQAKAVAAHFEGAMGMMAEPKRAFHFPQTVCVRTLCLICSQGVVVIYHGVNG